MPARGLQTLLATALTDAALCTALLARDPIAFAEFDLTADEIARLQALSAPALEDFAHQDHLLFYV